MANFFFKQFVIWQERAAMKVNTDGVLLPAWLSLKLGQTTILDVGSGTGVISLIMAQRMSQLEPKREFEIEAVEIDLHSYDETLYNFKNSPWSENLTVHHKSFQHFCTLHSQPKFDLIVSNPPYFTSSLRGEESARDNARHNHLLPLEILLEGAFSLLNQQGRLALILPVAEGERAIKFAKERNLFRVERLCRVKSLERGEVKRYMIEFQKSDKVVEKSSSYPQEELVIQKRGGKYYTLEYHNLVRELYKKEPPIYFGSTTGAGEERS